MNPSLSRAAGAARSQLRNVDAQLGEMIIDARRQMPVAIRRAGQGAVRARILPRSPSSILSMNILFKAVKYNRMKQALRQQRMAASVAAARPAAAREAQARQATLSRMRASTGAHLGATLMQKGVPPELLMGMGRGAGGGMGPDPARAAYISQAAQRTGGGRWL